MFFQKCRQKLTAYLLYEGTEFGLVVEGGHVGEVLVLRSTKVSRWGHLEKIKIFRTPFEAKPGSLLDLWKKTTNLEELITLYKTSKENVDFNIDFDRKNDSINDNNEEIDANLSGCDCPSSIGSISTLFPSRSAITSLNINLHASGNSANTWHTWALRLAWLLWEFMLVMFSTSDQPKCPVSSNGVTEKRLKSCTKRSLKSCGTPFEAKPGSLRTNGSVHNPSATSLVCLRPSDYAMGSRHTLKHIQAQFGVDSEAVFENVRWDDVPFT
ncbi:unnamed protein product [Lepeophtheirus salmonis]|uniref:(salmon louse) hypothetical protein n=1 Tax=Lepeophtheirus salmonis TaxID=72036 RepID=A0A7R8D631_LEPSM|nr:unnamed protein product [Lepeophtheirus salmonis]CAF3037112.1 unnamed protein product [Lepeophtheirus salmonis]